MIPNDYDLWLERNRPAAKVPTEAAANAAAQLPQPTAADVKRAKAVGALESARHQAVTAADALTAAALDASGARYVVAEIDRELAWLSG